MTEPIEAGPEQDVAPTPRWGLGDAGIAFAAGLLGTLLTTGFYVAVTGREEGTGLIAWSLVGLWAGFGLVTLRASRRKGTGSLATDFGLRIEPRDIGLGIVVGLLAQFVLVNGIVTLFHLIHSGIDVGRQAKEVTGDAKGTTLLYLAPFLCAGAPFFEELYFRGLLQRSAVRRMGVVRGAALSAVAFGLVHASADLNGWSTLALVTALAAFGAVLGILAYRTGRLGPGLVAHCTFNALTLLALAATK